MPEAHVGSALAFQHVGCCSCMAWRLRGMPAQLHAQPTQAGPVCGPVARVLPTTQEHASLGDRSLPFTVLQVPQGGRTPGSQTALRTLMHSACVLRHGPARRTRARQYCLMMLMLLNSKSYQPL